MAFTSNKKPEGRDFDDYSTSTSVSSSFFGKTMKIEGEITSDEDVTIEGKLKGQLKVSKTLTIGKDGYVNGKISASVVQISGEAEGEISASEKLEISSGGQYTGNIQAETFVVAEGAKLKGTINMASKKEKEEKPAVKTAAPSAAPPDKSKDKKPDESGEPEKGEVI